MSFGFKTCSCMHDPTVWHHALRVHGTFCGANQSTLLDTCAGTFLLYRQLSYTNIIHNHCLILRFTEVRMVYTAAPSFDRVQTLPIITHGKLNLNFYAGYLLHPHVMVI
jgi:hypothetical protein